MGDDSLLDDFSKKRLQEMRPIHELRAIAQRVELTYMLGLIVTNYTRRDLDIMRVAGRLNGHELAWLGHLDKFFADGVLEDLVDDTSTCAHCGGSLERTRNVIKVPAHGRTVAYHGAKRACANAAGWRRAPKQPDGEAEVREFKSTSTT